jgi:hypothetical protein
VGFIFAVKADPVPDYRAILDGIGLDDVKPVPDEDFHPEDGGAWPPGVYHFYRPFESSRGVEVSIEDEKGEFWVRVNTLASPEDYDLALRFVNRVAQLTGNPIESGEDDVTPRERLRDVFSREWIAEEIGKEAGVVVTLIRDENKDYHYLTLRGCVRPFHIGRRVLAELEAAGPPEGLPDRLIDAIREVQFIDTGEYFCADVLTAKAPDGTKFTAAAFGPDIKYLLPDVQRLAVMGDDADKEPILVQSEKLPELIPADRWQWLDERQMLVEPTPLQEWDEVRRRARAVAIEVVPHRSKVGGKERNQRER